MLRAIALFICCETKRVSRGEVVQKQRIFLGPMQALGYC